MFSSEQHLSLKITGISLQARDKSRVNVSVNGKYRCSLDIHQVAELGIHIGQEYTEEQLIALEEESLFGKLYTRTLEYCFIRPRSRREVKDYLYRKTRQRRDKNGELKAGVSVELTERVFERLVEKGYIDDFVFAQFWVENRHLRKGSSIRRLMSELSAKGVDHTIVQQVMTSSDRADTVEIQKIIAKKYRRYDDTQKLLAYLARLGFSYDDSKQAVADYEASLVDSV
jgi:regulatory protein